MKCLTLVYLSWLVTMNACAQQARTNDKEMKVGGSCEGCEAIYECPVSFDRLDNTDTLADFNDQGPRMEISGVVYQHDGKTPAPGVVIYFYHTDQRGIYPKKGNEQGWARRHGYLRGWVKTDEKGRYRFFTLRPGVYPTRNSPAHIHATIKEPGKTEYWIEEFVFADDPLLVTVPPSREPRGGNGVLALVERDGMLRGGRDIILGLHVEGYPR